MDVGIVSLMLVGVVLSGIAAGGWWLLVDENRQVRRRRKALR